MHKAYVDCQLIFLNSFFFLLFNQRGGRERCQMKVSPIFPLKFRAKALCKAMFQRTLTLTQSNTAWKSSMYPFCVFFIVEVKVLIGSLVLRAVSKGLNAPHLTFDPAVCEKRKYSARASKKKIRPARRYAHSRANYHS